MTKKPVKPKAAVSRKSKSEVSDGAESAGAKEPLKLIVRGFKNRDKMPVPSESISVFKLLKIIGWSNLEAQKKFAQGSPSTWIRWARPGGNMPDNVYGWLYDLALEMNEVPKLEHLDKTERITYRPQGRPTLGASHVRRTENDELSAILHEIGWTHEHARRRSGGLVGNGTWMRWVDPLSFDDKNPKYTTPNNLLVWLRHVRSIFRRHPPPKYVRQTTEAEFRRNVAMSIRAQEQALLRAQKNPHSRFYRGPKPDAEPAVKAKPARKAKTKS